MKMTAAQFAHADWALGKAQSADEQGKSIGQMIRDANPNSSEGINQMREMYVYTGLELARKLITRALNPKGAKP